MQDFNFYPSRFQNLHNVNNIAQNQTQTFLKGYNMPNVQKNKEDIPYPILDKMMQRVFSVIFNGRVSAFVETEVYRMHQGAMELYKKESRSGLFKYVEIKYDKRDWGYAITGSTEKDTYLLCFSHPCFTDFNAALHHAIAKLAPQIQNAAKSMMENAESHAHMWLHMGENPSINIEHGIQYPNNIF